MKSSGLGEGEKPGTCIVGLVGPDAENGLCSITIQTNLVELLREPKRLYGQTRSHKRLYSFTGASSQACS